LNCEDRSCAGESVDKFEENGISFVIGPSGRIFVESPFEMAVRHHITVLDCCVFRRDIFLSTRHFDESLTIGEDHDIILQMAMKGPFVFCNEVGAVIFRRRESIMNLSAQLNHSGMKARLSWAVVFEKFLQSEELSPVQQRCLCFKYSRNQRALGNLFLRAREAERAREVYKHAWTLYPSVPSGTRLGLSYLPRGVAELFLHKEGNVSP
jgi:hypothetical protein